MICYITRKTAQKIRDGLPNLIISKVECDALVELV